LFHTFGHKRANGHAAQLQVRSTAIRPRKAYVDLLRGVSVIEDDALSLHSTKAFVH